MIGARSPIQYKPINNSLGSANEDAHAKMYMLGDYVFLKILSMIKAQVRPFASLRGLPA